MFTHEITSLVGNVGSSRLRIENEGSTTRTYLLEQILPACEINRVWSVFGPPGAVASPASGGGAISTTLTVPAGSWIEVHEINTFKAIPVGDERQVTTEVASLTLKGVAGAPNGVPVLMSVRFVQGDPDLMYQFEGINNQAIEDLFFCIRPDQQACLDWFENNGGGNLCTLIESVQNLTAAVAAVPALDGNHAPILRTTAVAGVAPTALEAATPINGDTASIKLSNGLEEFWAYTAGAWGLVYTNTPLVIDGNQTPLLRTNATANVAPTTLEIPTPFNGDSASIKLSNGSEEMWVRTAGAWVRVYTNTPPVGDGHHFYAFRSDTIRDVAPVVGIDIPSAIEGDTVLLRLDNGIEEHWAFLGGAWVNFWATFPDGNHTNIRRTTATAKVPPAILEAGTPFPGDTASVKLLNGAEEMWSYESLAWVLKYTNAPGVEDEINVTDVTFPITFPTVVLPGAPVFAPNTPADTTKIYSIINGTNVAYAKWNGTQYISVPAPAASVVVTDLGTGTVRISAGAGGIQEAIRPIPELPLITNLTAGDRFVFNDAGTPNHGAVTLGELVRLIRGERAVASVITNAPGGVIPATVTVEGVVIPTDTYVDFNGSYASPVTMPVPAYNGQRLVINHLAGLDTSIAITNTSMLAPVLLTATRRGAEFVAIGSQWHLVTTV